MSTFRIVEGDCTVRLAELDAGSIQTCVTSPPYWGLRDYGTATWEGGDPECDHIATERPPVVGSSSGLGKPADGGPRRISTDNNTHEGYRQQYRDTCGKCGARRIDSQLGLEPTPEQYVENMVAVFREVRRVLRDDGTLWLNLGDSYVSNGFWPDAPSNRENAGGLTRGAKSMRQRGRQVTKVAGLKTKDLVGIPWMVAFALRADGWYLRSDIIWAKPNPMPESVTDRPTKAHEYLFLLTKQPRYYYDADAIRESATYDGPNGAQQSPYAQGFGRRTPEQEAERRIKRRSVRPGIDTNGGGQGNGAMTYPAHSRNKRSVWTVSTKPFPGAHFATFPPKLIEPCILAGSPPKCCGECGAPWERALGRGELDESRPQARRALELAREHGLTDAHLDAIKSAGVTDAGKAQTTQNGTGRNADEVKRLAAEAKEALGGYHREFLLARPTTTGWRSACEHDDDSGTATVLDPFNGAGTTGLVALRHDRDYIGIELNPEYAQMARDRIVDDAPLLNAEAAA